MKNLVIPSKTQLELNKKLLEAVRGNNYKKILRLQNYEADVKAANKNDTTENLKQIADTVNQNNIAALSALLKQGADVDATNERGITALMAAARLGNFKMVQFLLERGANVNNADNDGMTALIAAARLGNFKMVQFLLERGANVNNADNDGMTALMWTAEYRDPFEFAASNVHFEIAQFLVKSGAKLDNAKNDNSRTTLMTAVINGDIKKNIRIAKLLVEQGSGLDLADKFGMTAFMIATWYGHIEIIQFILEHGADINDVRSIRNETELLLHKSEDDVNPSDKEMTALLLAAESYHFGSEKKTEIINMIITSALFRQGQGGRKSEAFLTLLRSGNLNDPQVSYYISPETATLIAAMGVDADSPLAGMSEMQLIAAFVINYNAHPLRQQNPGNRIDQTIVNHLRALRDEIAEKIIVSSESISDQSPKTRNQAFLKAIFKANAAMANPALLELIFEQPDPLYILKTEADKLKAEAAADDDVKSRIEDLETIFEEIAELAAENVLESKIECLSNIHREIAARLGEDAPFFRTNVIIASFMTNLSFLKLLDLTAREDPQQENPPQENPDLSASDPQLASAFTMWKKLIAEFEAQAEAKAAAKITSSSSATILLPEDDSVLDATRDKTTLSAQQQAKTKEETSQQETKAAEQETSLTFLAETEPTAASDQASTQTTAATQAYIIMAAFLNASEEERQTLANCLTVSKAGLKLDVEALRKIFDFLNPAFSFLTRVENQALYNVIVTISPANAGDKMSGISDTVATLGQGDDEKVPLGHTLTFANARRLLSDKQMSNIATG